MNDIETLIIPSGSVERFCCYAKLRMNPPFIELAGLSSLLPGYRVERPQCLHHTLIFVLDGNLNYRSGTLDGVLKKNDMLFLPCDSEQIYYTETGVEMFWFHFFGDAALNAAANYPFSRPARFLSELAGTVNLSLAAEEQARREKSSHHSIKLYCLAELVGEYLLEELNCREISKELPDYHRKKLCEIFTRAAKNPEQNWDVPRLARFGGYSPSHFFSLCRKFYHDTPMGKLRSIRLNHAQQLLLSGTGNLEEIAGHCGYSSANAFANAFKKHFAISPLAFRKKIRQ